ncbi:MAG: carbohydrate porin [Desulfobacterales bacterium]
MMRKQLVTVLTCLMMSVLGARAEDAATRQEIDQLKQRIEELEKKQEEDEEEFGKLSDLAKYVSIGGVLSGAYQYEWVSGPSDPGDLGRGAVAFQPEVSITPTENDEIFFLFGFAAGNGLPGVTPFILAPWAAGLEDDVKDINGRNRDYLLQAWYKHTFAFSEDHSLGLTGGIIDATNYLDDNAYACDEYTQFMNEALVNASNGILPSWDIGGALEWDYGRFGARGVYMNVGENDDGNNYNFYGAQVMYALETPLGEGHYRVNYNFTSKAFLDPDDTSEEQRDVLIFSFDQELGDIFGAWVRFAFGSDKALVDYKSLYSGGINISGRWWGRKQDTIGVGYGYLDGPEQTEESVKYTQVAEGYVRFGLNDYLFLTFDLQYMKDKYVDTASDNDVDGWIAGVRMTAEF